MGFCRRCGDIVAGARCKCGGTAVAPVVPWNQSSSEAKLQDRWSKTYVHRARSVSPTRPLTTQTTGQSTAPAKRFPRPVSYMSSGPSPALGKHVSAHITSTTAQSNRPPSPLKYSTTLPAPESDILPSLTPHDTTLSKVYGSVLQPKESLITHSCAICASPFPPDATIYPNPTAPSTSQFLCRPCFETNGGSKGTCPTCLKPVLILRSEGGFIHAAEKFWHKRCFNCSGCFKNVGDMPMVDLLGRPSCADCFENCLKRDPSTPKKKLSTSTNSSPRVVDKAKNIGGMGSHSKGARSREGSPAIEELEQRLGISKSREGSPALEDLTQRLSSMGKDNRSRHSSSNSPRRYTHSDQESSPLPDRSRGRLDIQTDDRGSPARRYEINSRPGVEARASPIRFTSGSPSPVRRDNTGSPAPTQDAIEEMKQRFIKQSSQSPGPKPPISPTSSAGYSTPPLRLSRSSTSFKSSPKINPLQSYDDYPYSPSMPPTPDLMSDFSDTMTQSSFSGPDSPPRNYDGSDDIFNVSKAYGTGYGSRFTMGDFLDGVENVITEETASELGSPNRTPGSIRALRTPASTLSKTSMPVSSPSSSIRPKSVKSPIRDEESSAPTSCANCRESLFSVRSGGKFVTVPGDSTEPPKTYHVRCFKCVICRGVFSEANAGQAVFVKVDGGACHLECAPPAKTIIHKSPSAGSLTARLRSSSIPAPMSNIPVLKAQPAQSSSSRFERSQTISTPTPTFRRFGNTTTCPGCSKSVSPMEQGVVPGPQGTRWHASCLVCGGKKTVASGWGMWKGREEKMKSEPGCGKRLDSAAKSSGDGAVWCRECLLLLGVGGSPQVSPTRGPLVPSYTGSKVAPQFTGTTTIARQFTGLGGGDPGLLRQLTGGGLSPTRSISPTKQLGGGGMRPRPKSVIGMRSSKSIDEGRGMFLVRQLTGASSVGWGEDL